MSDTLKKRPDFETICAHWGENRDEYQGAVIPPIFQNSLFTYPDCKTREAAWPLIPAEDSDETDRPIFHDYTRFSNPTTAIVEAKIAALEGGEAARCFGSGMGAISAAIMSCVKSGDHVIAPLTTYGPAKQFLNDYLPRFGISTTFIDGSDIEEWKENLRPETTLLYLESPSSMVMKQQNLAAVAGIAKSHGATTICDNSWASPYFQNPIAHGVDMVVHSATKYLGGHSDIVAGVVVGNEKRMKKMALEEGCLLGSVLDPFAAWLLMRGIRTLPVRMDRHEQSAKEIIRRLRSHAAVEEIFYPGQENDSQPELTRAQLRGTSGLLSLVLKENSKQATYRFIDSLSYFGLGCSWGGFESLAVPAHLSGKSLGMSDGKSRWIVRLHIGLESVEDLWKDLEAALGRE